MTRKNSLQELIDALPTPDVDTKDVKNIVLQIMMDLGNDGPDMRPLRGALKIKAASVLLNAIAEERAAELAKQKTEPLGDMLLELLRAGK